MGFSENVIHSGGNKSSNVRSFIIQSNGETGLTSFNNKNRAKVSDEKKVSNEAFRGFLVLENTRNLFIR